MLPTSRILPSLRAIISCKYSLVKHHVGPDVELNDVQLAVDVGGVEGAVLALAGVVHQHVDLRCRLAFTSL